MNEQINEYISQLPEDQQNLIQKLRQLIFDTIPNTREVYKWNRPVYSLDSDFAYIKSNKKHVNLGFFNYLKIKDIDHKLEGTGKDMRHIKFKDCNELDEPMIKEWLIAVTFK